MDSIAKPSAKSVIKLSIQKTVVASVVRTNSPPSRPSTSENELAHEAALRPEPGMPVPVHWNQKGEIDQGVAEREDEVDREEWQEPERQGRNKGETPPFALDALDQGRAGKEQEEGDVEGEDDLYSRKKSQLPPPSPGWCARNSRSRSGRLRVWEVPGSFMSGLAIWCS
jgi:hypothetical protein